ncbi:tetraspanin Tsp2 [Mycena belliarum]|uniref:Tetraspanin Tsp2 n=1 Tax=Mycena belliarum TaxID=1033014 RepID=A0AAD6UHK9_9AGAR|nr:tetraspanin Tsp2 [Mycena belliae]
MPLISVDRSPSSSSFTHSRAHSQPLSWISPEDYDATTPLDAPIPRPGSIAARSRTTSFAAASHLGEGSSRGSVLGGNADNRTSLSVNYLPTKFSDALAVGNARRRRRAKQDTLAMARGGGVDAFKKGEARMPEDRDDLHPSPARKGWLDRAETGSRWTRFKWVLLVFTAVYSLLAIGALIAMLLIWLDYIQHADVIRVANRTELIFTTLAASFALLTAIFGLAGVMLNNRSFLAFYCFFLWISFGFLVIPGYLTYRQQNLNLQGKLNFQWSRALDIDARRRVQNALGCCGYFSPFVEASISARCYARSVLPGCKGPFLHFERAVLRRWFIGVFSLAGFHICTIVASLLCANHVTYRFGKGMTPKAYRLDAASVAAIMESYAAQLAEQYGPDVAAAAMEHSRADVPRLPGPSPKLPGPFPKLSGTFPPASTSLTNPNVSK